MTTKPDHLIKIPLLDLKDLDVSTNLGKMPRFGMVPKDCLYVDPIYQRGLSSNRSIPLIRKIAEDFTWAKFQPLTVVERTDGRYLVVDGQHRATAALLLLTVVDVPCWIVPAPETAAQAKVFAGVNGDRTNVNSLGLFKAALAANDPDALQIKKVCEQAGITIVYQISGAVKKLQPLQTMAVSTIRKLLAKHGEKHVLAALQTLAASYPDVPGQIRAETINALTLLFRQHGERIDRDRLIRLLWDNHCEKLLIAARQVRDLLGGSTEACLVKALVQRYDHGLAPSRKLDQGKDASALAEVA